MLIGLILPSLRAVQNLVCLERRGGLIPSELRVTSRGSRCLQLLHVGIGSAFVEQSLGYV